MLFSIKLCQTLSCGQTDRQTYRQNHTRTDADDRYSQDRFPFKRNRLRCVRCVNENRKKRKRLRWQASSQSWLPLLRPSIPIGWRLRLLRENFTQQMQVPDNRNARSKQWQP